jgi:hypothetical protein
LVFRKLSTRGKAGRHDFQATLEFLEKANYRQQKKRKIPLQRIIPIEPRRPHKLTVTLRISIRTELHPPTTLVREKNDDPIIDITTTTATTANNNMVDIELAESKDELESAEKEREKRRVAMVKAYIVTVVAKVIRSAAVTESACCACSCGSRRFGGIWLVGGLRWERFQFDRLLCLPSSSSSSHLLNFPEGHLGFGGVCESSHQDCGSDSDPFSGSKREVCDGSLVAVGARWACGGGVRVSSACSGGTRVWSSIAGSIGFLLMAF